MTQTQNTQVPFVIIVITRFVGATTRRGSRIIATAEYGARSQSYPYEHSRGHNSHRAAAQQFMGEDYVLIGEGESPTGEGEAWVFKRKGV